MEHSLRSRPKGKTVGRHSGAKLLRIEAEVFRRDAEVWGLTQRSVAMSALAPIIASLAIIAIVPFPGVFRWVIEEDRLVEWLQFVLILSASLLFAALSARLIRTGPHGLALPYVLLTLGAFFIAGEEISWGQRIFGWRTPEELRAINAQQEISLHNIYWLHRWFIYAVMLGGMYGAIMPLIGLALPADWRSSMLGHLLIPPLCLVPAFFMPFGYRLTRIVVPFERYYPRGDIIYVIVEFSELTELCLYFGLLVFAWLNLRRLRQEPRSAA